MASQANKVTDLIKQKGKISFSFEVNPDVAEEDINNLKVDPAFFSVTWHAKSHQCKGLDIAPLRTAYFLRSKQKDVLLHLSCDMLKKNYLESLTVALQEKGICNLFVVLGESYDPNTSDFKSTLELIRYIKEKAGNYFCIGIAGFPDCNDEKLHQMKEKVDCGADFIITQAFFEPDVFKNLLDKCEQAGISVPIIPGVFPFETYKQLSNFVNLCKIKVSDDLLLNVEIKEKQENSCVDIVKNLIQVLSSELNTYHFHVFTLNKLQSAANLIKELH